MEIAKLQHRLLRKEKRSQHRELSCCRQGFGEPPHEQNKFTVFLCLIKKSLITMSLGLIKSEGQDTIQLCTKTMKNVYYVLMVLFCLMLTSCQTYRFYQVYETRPTQENTMNNDSNGTLVYENEHCIIGYNFWSNHGSAGFSFYNKTNEIVYIYLDKSFFTRNGIAYDLYVGREWNNSLTSNLNIMTTQYSQSLSQSLSLSHGGVLSPKYTNSYFGMEMISTSVSESASKGVAVNKSTSIAHSTSVTTKEKVIIMIPPHKTKFIGTYEIINQLFLTCDLQYYPEKSSSISFTQDNSPIQFSNIISYSVGENGNIVSVENSFYVSSITNYTEPEIAVFEKREELCMNLKDVSEYKAKTKNGSPLYDCYIKKDICNFASSFYYIYDVRTSKKLYSHNKKYFYLPEYDAYSNKK